jgi:phenylalanyl-tRNA synthetase beta chain
LGLDLAEHLKLKNPLSSEQAYLRSNLLPSHLATLERNRMYGKAMRFYEISNVFLKRGKGEQPDEPLRLGITVLEPEAAYAVAKGILDSIADELNLDLVVRPAQAGSFAAGRYGEVLLDGVRVGGIGQLHPGVVRGMKLDGESAHFELDLTPLVAASTSRVYSPRSPFPTISRDVSLEVPLDVSWQAVKDATVGWDVVYVGDYFGPGLAEGKKGMTIRLKLSLPDRTPTEAEASELEEAVLARLRHKFALRRRD